MRTFWTPEQDAIMCEHYPCKPMRVLTELLARSEKAIYTRAKTLDIKKSAEYLASNEAYRFNGQEEASKVHRFKKGQPVWNKGMKGLTFEGSKPTQFKKGTRPPNYKPVGTIREVEDGFLEMKMAEGMRQWKLLQRVVWERCNGAIPAGHVIAFRDGDKKNMEITNLALLTRGENMLRNSYHRYGVEIAKVIQLKGAITRQINKRTKQNEQ